MFTIRTNNKAVADFVKKKKTKLIHKQMPEKSGDKIIFKSGHLL